MIVVMDTRAAAEPAARTKETPIETRVSVRRPSNHSRSHHILSGHNNLHIQSRKSTGSEPGQERSCLKDTSSRSATRRSASSCVRTASVASASTHPSAHFRSWMGRHSMAPPRPIAQHARWRTPARRPLPSRRCPTRHHHGLPGDRYRDSTRALGRVPHRDALPERGCGVPLRCRGADPIGGHATPRRQL